MNASDVEKFNQAMGRHDLAGRLALIAEHCSSAVFTTSLGKEDQYLLWQIARTSAPLRVATLQTGRLFPETLDLIAKSSERFEIEIEQFEPEANAVAGYIERYGNNGFYDSLEARKACCHVRKVAPLNRVLANADGWVTGMTRAQSDGRSNIPFVEYDEAHDMLKFNPIADLSIETMERDLSAHSVPVSALHARGYPSIGCEPCTRAVKPGEHPRAGRWWWEQNNSSECGLHTHNLTTPESA